MRSTWFPLLASVVPYLALWLVAVPGTASAAPGLLARAPSGVPVLGADWVGEGLLEVEVPVDLPDASGGYSDIQSALVVLPPEVSLVRIRDTGDGDARLAGASVGPVFVMRGIKMAPLSFSREARTPTTGPQGGAVRLLLEASVDGGIRGAVQGIGAGGDGAPGGYLTDSRYASPEMLSLLGLLDDAGPRSGPRAGYLIITAPEYEEALAPLVDWKRRCGYDVHVATLDETGSTRQEIKAYIQGAYENWDLPPLYVLLVGDVGGTSGVVPTWSIQGNVSDHPYACVDGDDFIADLFIGRLSAETELDVEVQVAKTVGYESAPDTLDGTDWFTRALLVAGNYGSSTPVPTSRWVRSELLSLGFTGVDSVYYPDMWDGGPAIKYYINRGVSLVNYRGWAYGDAGWQPPEYTSDDIPLLSNGWKLPVIFSIVCHTGNFGGDEACFGEVWLRSGSPEEPKGAVAFIGTGEHWSHSRWNDRVDIGLIEALCHDGIRQMGQLLQATKLGLLVHFAGEIEPLPGHEDESVEYYSHIYNLLGDPSLAVHVGVPRGVRLPGLPRSVSFATNSLSISVVGEDGETPVAGACVTLTQGDRVLASACSDEGGLVDLQFVIPEAEPISVDVTGEGIYPASFTVTVDASSLGLTATDLRMGGGHLVPGQEAEVFVTIRNSGNEAVADAVLRVIDAPEVLEVLDEEASAGTIVQGESAECGDALVFKPDARLEDGTVLAVDLEMSDGATVLNTSRILLEVEAPRFSLVSASDGDDGMFDPGEECNLTLTFQNDGSVSGGASSVTIEAVGGMVSVLDGEAPFDAIGPGEEGTNESDPFRIAIPDTLAPGTCVPMRAVFTCADGPIVEAHFNLLIGSGLESEPIGPDEYGYYCYDSADIDFPSEAPAYEWIECSSLFGGSGEKLPFRYDNKSIVLLELPFTFRYYGVDYDSIRVSDNGWISFDTDPWYDIRNWAIPEPWGGGSMLAAFWDNLMPSDSLGLYDGIYALYDSLEHRFVVEWSRLRNWERPDSAASGHDDWDDRQTFEIVLYDPAYYPTRTGDGEIVFQYKEIVNNDWRKMFATVGIEDHTETRGIMYTYYNEYAPGAAPLSPGLAIKFTTDPPVFEPLKATEFVALVEPLQGDSIGVEVRWAVNRPDAILGVRLLREAGGWTIAVTSGWLPASSGGWRESMPRAGEPEAYVLEVLTRSGEVRRLASTGLRECVPSVGLTLEGSPVAGGSVRIAYEIPAGRPGRLEVFDLTGRLLESIRLREHSGSLEWRPGPAASASGIYWLRLRGGCDSSVRRLVLLR